MNILVSDTSVLIDIERGLLQEAIFTIGHSLTVPDLLYEQELRDYGGQEWLARGLQVVPLDDQAIAAAQELKQAQRSVSLIDCSAFVLSAQQGWTLLSGDGALRRLATQRGLSCHGFLWVVDKLEETGFNTANLADAIERVLTHRRCRLPVAECNTRIARLRSSNIGLLGKQNA